MLEVLVIIIRPGVENRRSALPRPEDERRRPDRPLRPPPPGAAPTDGEAADDATRALRRAAARAPGLACSPMVVWDRVRHISDRLIRFAMSSAGNDTGSGGWCPGNVCHLDGWQ